MPLKSINTVAPMISRHLQKDETSIGLSNHSRVGKRGFFSRSNGGRSPSSVTDNEGLLNEEGNETRTSSFDDLGEASFSDFAKNVNFDDPQPETSAQPNASAGGKQPGKSFANKIMPKVNLRQLKNIRGTRLFESSSSLDDLHRPRDEEFQASFSGVPGSDAGDDLHDCEGDSQNEPSSAESNVLALIKANMENKEASRSSDGEDEPSESESTEDEDQDDTVQPNRTESNVLALIKADQESKESSRKSHSSPKSRRTRRRIKSSDDRSPTESRQRRTPRVGRAKSSDDLEPTTPRTSAGVSPRKSSTRGRVSTRATRAKASGRPRSGGRSSRRKGTEERRQSN